MMVARRRCSPRRCAMPRFIDMFRLPLDAPLDICC